MKLKPMADNVLLKQNEAAETTVSGIILATTTKEKPAIYEVVAVGPGTKDVQMTLKPMADNVLLRQHEAAEATVGGIILATSTKEKPAIYEVVAVGPGTKDVTMTLTAGDKVVVSKFVGTDVTLDKVDYKFVKQDEVLAIVAD